MKCPTPEQWDLFSMSLLDEPTSAAMRSHAEQCDMCRAVCGQARREHTLLLRTYEVLDHEHDVQREQLLAALPAASPSETTDGRGHGGRGLGGIIMLLRHPRARAAVVMLPAACLVVAVAYFLTATPSVAFAQVLERLRMVKTMVCQVEVTCPAAEGEITVHGTMTMAWEGDQRCVLYKQTDGTQSFQFGDDGAMSVTNVAGSQRVTIRMSDDARPPMAVGPDEWIKQLLAATEDADRTLGRRTIDGRDALGFQVAGWKLGFGPRPNDGASPDASGTLTLWVDAKTRLPVLFDVETTGWQGRPLHVKYDQFQWDVPVELPAPEPPPATDEAPLQMPPATETSFVEGLRQYRQMVERSQALVATLEQKFTDREQREEAVRPLRQLLAGVSTGYPERLDAQWFSPQVAMLTGMAMARDRMAGDPEATRRNQEESLRALGASVFYQRLVLDKAEPEYFGPTVAPGDATAVLLRWKLPDGQTRVIYGDLHAETAAEK